MVVLLERLASDFPAFAPDLVSDPRVSLYRIYRDTRFSDDKTPLKTHVAAHFPSRKFPKGQGAGLYSRNRAAVGLDRRRLVHAVAGGPAANPRVGRAASPHAASHRDVGRVHAHGRQSRRRAAFARAARVREGSSGRGLPAPQAVRRRVRASRRFRAQPEVLPGAAQGLPRRVAAGRLSQPRHAQSPRRDFPRRRISRTP